MAKKAAYKVKSLAKLISQVNALAPKRSKASDGWIGDAAHAARKSEHNPDTDGSVDAVDITHDPRHGCDAQRLADAIVASRDRRVKTLIHNGRILTPAKGWAWRKYNGRNKHTQHLHIDVIDLHQDDATAWNINAAFGKPTAAPVVAKQPKPAGNLTKPQVDSVLKRGAKGDFVKELQQNLNKLGYGPLKEDSSFGLATEKAVKQFQRAMGLKEDGWAGNRTVAAIGKELAKSKLKPKIVAAEAKVEEAEVKVEAAKKVVDDAAAEGKRVSNTEWLSGILGAGGIVGVIKEAADTIKETTQSVGEMAVSVGPWILVGLLITAGTAYIILDRRRKRLEARAVKETL